MFRPASRTLRALVAASTATLLGLGVLAVAVAPSASAAASAAPAAARSTNPATPGNFAGFGFDQCLTPTQASMDRWLTHSPFLAVGIYISGTSRACRNQPNLTPTWVSTQLRKGWRLLPITLGPQASCQPRFPRYADDVRINPTPGPRNLYGKARAMGRAEAADAVKTAKALGIVPGSTLWYDMEGYNNRNTHCRESALAFLSGWAVQTKRLGYVSGVYSSASSGIADLDLARRTRPSQFNFPERIWIARWDGVANTSTTYIPESGWRPGGRMKQYLGGHNETWGGVTINIDSNWLDLGTGATAARESKCGGVQVNFSRYRNLRIGTQPTAVHGNQVRALKCLLTEAGQFRGSLTPFYGTSLAAASRRFRAANGLPANGAWSQKAWIKLHAAGAAPVLKRGSTGSEVRRAQRAINAAATGAAVPMTGSFGADSTAAVRAYQAKAGVAVTGVVNPATWAALRAGRR